MAGERIVIDGGATSLGLAVGDDGRLHQTGLGSKEAVAADLAFPVLLYPLALPTHGEEATRVPALRLTHADGATGTRLVVADPADISVEAHDHGTVHRIRLTDRVAPVSVTVCWRAWPDHGLIEQWSEIANHGDEPITVHRAASASPALGGPTSTSRTGAAAGRTSGSRSPSRSAAAPRPWRPRAASAPRCTSRRSSSPRPRAPHRRPREPCSPPR